jgi:hypothetical protein
MSFPIKAKMRRLASAKKQLTEGRKILFWITYIKLTKVVFLVKGKITSLRDFYVPLFPRGPRAESFSLTEGEGFSLDWLSAPWTGRSENW